MHVAVEATGTRHSGAAVVLTAMLEALVSSDCVTKVTVYCSSRDVLGRAQASPKLCPVIRETRTPISKVAWQVVGLRRATARLAPDVLLCLGNGGIGAVGLPQATFIQQSLPFCVEALAQSSVALRMRVACIRASMRMAVARSQMILVQTITMRDAVAHAFGVPADGIDVIVPMTPRLPRHAPTCRAYEPAHTRGSWTALYVGNDSTYKNLPTLLAGFDLACRTRQGSLLMCGPRIRAKVTAPGVLDLGYVVRADLFAVYSRATILIMPSFTETVGLPMLEAMEVGVPIVAADRSYAHEICSNAAVYFDPHSAADLSAKLLSVVADADLRRTLIGRGFTRAASRDVAEPAQTLVRRLQELAEC